MLNPFIQLLSRNQPARPFVESALQLFEANLRERALLALAEWERLGCAAHDWLKVVPDFLTALGALQRPAAGSWNFLLVTLAKVFQAAKEHSDPELRARLTGASVIPRALAWLDEPLEPIVTTGLRPLGTLVNAQLKSRARLRDALTWPIILRNRIAHDGPRPDGWWEEAARALRPLVGVHCRVAQPLAEDGHAFAEPWFIRSQEEALVFNGLDKQAVIYVSLSGNTHYDSARRAAVLLNFQKLLGQARVQERDFSKLLARLAPPDAKGVLLGDYLLGAPVGEGGHAIVHLGRQLSTGQKVALKVLRDGLPAEERQRFQQEAAHLARLNHPHILKVHGQGQDAWKPPQHYSLSGEPWYAELARTAPIKSYIALEWVDGRTLEAVFQERATVAPDVRQLAEWFAQAAEALAAAHAEGLIHRDVKPSNLMVTADGQVKLMDFGIARSQSDARTLHTDKGQVVGTLKYMAPEQLRAADGQTSVGLGADIYSLCATFYELFTGVRLYRHDCADAAAYLAAKTSGQPPEAPHLLERDIPWEIETILLIGLQTDPKDRYAAMADLAADLRRFLANRPILKRPPPLRRRVQLFYRRNRRVAHVVAPVLCISCAVAAILGIEAYQRGQKAEELGVAVKTEEQKRKDEEEKRQKADIEASKSKIAAAASGRLKVFQEYIADMREIPRLWERAQIDAIRDRLQKYADTPDNPRGFEWHYWKRAIESSQKWQAGDRVTSVAWAPDGSRLYASDLTGQLTTWDRATGESKPIRGSGTRTMEVAVAPDGERVAVLTWATTVGKEKLQDPKLPVVQQRPDVEMSIEVLKDDKIIRTIPGKLSKMTVFRTAAFSPDHKRLYVGTQFGHVPTYDTETGQFVIDLASNSNSLRNNLNPRQVMGPPNGPINCVAVSPDGQTVAAGGSDARIWLWKASGHYGGLLEGHRGVLTSLAFSSDGSKLVSRSMPPEADDRNEKNFTSGRVIVWDLANSRKLREIPIAGPNPSLRAHARDGTPLPLGGNYRAEFIRADSQVVVGDGNVVKIWDYVTSELTELKGHAAPIVSLRVCPRVGLVATADVRGEVRIWDLANSADEQVVSRTEMPFRAIRSPLRMANAKAGAYTVYPTNTSVGDLWRLPAVYSPSGRYAAAPALGPQITVYESEDATRKEVQGIKWPPEGVTLPKSTRPRDPYSHGGTIPLQCLAFRTDDEMYIAGTSVLLRANLRTGTVEKVGSVSVGSPPEFQEKTLVVPLDALMAMAFSPDGSKAVLGYASGDAAVYDADTWELVARLHGHTRGITSLAFTADGNRLASCSGRYTERGSAEREDRPGEVMIWDTHTWESCLTLRRKVNSEFLGVGFQEDGRTLYALTNRIEPDSVRQPGGELIRWGTSDFAALTSIPRPSETPKKLLAGTVLRSTVPEFQGRTGYVAIALHPSGRLAAARSFRNQMILWDIHTRELIREVQYPPTSMSRRNELSFSSDGKRLLYVSDAEVSVYSVPDLKLDHGASRKIGIHDEAAIQMILDSWKATGMARKGEEIADSLNTYAIAMPAGPNELVSLEFTRQRGCRLVKGNESHRLEIPAVSLAAFSSDVRYLFVVTQQNVAVKSTDSAPREVRLVSVEDGKVLFTTGFTDHAVSYGFSGDGRTCFVLTVPQEDAKKKMTSPARLQRWAVPTGDRQPDASGFRWPCALAPDLSHAVIYAMPANLHAIDLTTGRQSERPVGVEAFCRGLAFFSDSRHFATFGGIPEVHIWDRLQPVDAPDNILFAATLWRQHSIWADGKQVAYQAPDLQLTILDLETQRKVSANPNASLGSLSFSIDGKRLGGVTGVGKLISIDAATGAVTQIASDPNKPGPKSPLGVIQYLATQVTGDGRLLNLRQASAQAPDAEKFCELYDGTTKLVAFRAPEGQRVHRAAIRPDGKLLALLVAPLGAKTNAFAIRIHAIPSGTLVAESSSFPSSWASRDNASMKFSSDLTRLELACVIDGGKPGESEVVAFDPGSGKELWTVTDLRARVFSVSPDGTLLARIDAEGRIVVETRDGRKPLAIYDPMGEISSLHFLTGGHELLSSAKDGTVRLWNVANVQMTRK